MEEEEEDGSGNKSKGKEKETSKHHNEDGYPSQKRNSEVEDKEHRNIEESGRDKSLIKESSAVERDYIEERHSNPALQRQLESLKDTINNLQK